MLSNYTGKKLLNVILGKSTGEQFSIGSSASYPYGFYNYDVYLGLCLSSAVALLPEGKITPDMTGADMAALEPTAAEYERIRLGGCGPLIANINLFWSAYFPVANDCAVQNNDILFFREANDAWTECSWWFIVDAADHLLAYGELTTPIAPILGKVPLVDIGDMSLSVAGVSEFIGNQICNVIVGHKGYVDRDATQGSSNTDLFVALCNSAPDMSMTGTTLAAIEPNRANGYLRARVKAQGIVDKMTTVADDGSTSNDLIMFSVVREGIEEIKGWGQITHFAFCDSQTAGTVLAFGALDTPFTPATDTVPLIRLGDLVVKFNPEPESSEI